MAPLAVHEGDQLGPVELRLDRATLVRYAGASGDFNPIHWSDAAAAKADLPGVLAHGMYTMGAAVQVVVDWVGDPGAIAGYEVRFSRPVVVPPVGEAVVQVTGVVATVADGAAAINLSVTVDGTKVLGKARVTVRL
ncbi:MAG: dehydratase [Bifidobacteriaceae bacterium]|jgi:acyl dehydratase|nr:dehydratase [Bifidobacteriaceae bacterium]